jgi:hypothetical protein
MDEAMVDRLSEDSDGSAVPTIAELLLSYRDRTGYSYKDMARKVRDEIQASRLQQLVTAPPKAFPERRTVELLAELLEVPTATIVLAAAAGLGIPVTQSGTMLERTLPPGTDDLTAEDREAIRKVTKSLVEARQIALRVISPEQMQAMHDSGRLFFGRHDDEDKTDAGPIDGPEPATVHDYGLAARRGESEGKRLRRQQDDDAGA